MRRPATESLDVICVGEALVDFLPVTPGRPVRAVEQWVRCSGGSPANVSVGVARLGARSAMLGVVGHDEFGVFLRESLAAEGVDVGHLRQTDQGKTGLVFISLDERGERSFAFFRTRAAEYFLDDRDVEPGFLASSRAVHFGSNSLLWRNAQRAVLQMLHLARGGDRIVSCDPNLRLHLWADPAELRDFLGTALPLCSVVKLAEDEVEFVTGEREPEAAAWALRKMGVALPVITLGSEGALFCWRDRVLRVPAPQVDAVDATGAGDGFVAGMLFGLTRLFAGHTQLGAAGVGELREVMSFAAQVGARVVTRLGAVAGLPTHEEVKANAPRMFQLVEPPQRTTGRR